MKLHVTLGLHETIDIKSCPPNLAKAWVIGAGSGQEGYVFVLKQAPHSYLPDYLLQLCGAR